MMKDYFDYIKNFSIKKKIILFISLLVFLYEAFAGAYIICDHISEDLAYKINNILVDCGFLVALLNFPVMLISYFRLSIVSAYCVIFPLIYFAFNLFMFYKKRYKSDVMILNFTLQLTNPIMLMLLIWALITFVKIVFDVNLLESFFVF